MTSEVVARRILVVTLGFAALVVSSSLFVPNDDDRRAVTFVLITLGLVPYSHLLKLERKAARELSNTEDEERS